MNFRRQPFQFSTIDPVKRQAELQKRFGLPTTNSDMFVDFLNPGMMSSGIRESSSLGGSPRLQHRVPVFTEKVKGDTEQKNVDSSHKPRVRVIPIQVEGVDGGKRQRNFSGPANVSDRNGENSQGKLPETFQHPNSFKIDEKPKAPSQSKVCNIPIQIEPRDVKSDVDSSLPTTEPAKKLKAEVNGCAASSDKKMDFGVRTSNDKIKNLGIRSLPLKQIDDVLKKLKLYTAEVEKFSGTSKDKQYRYLDEMLTRCMLDLDNVDTMGLEDIRKERKEAVRQVQYYVDLLDTKVNEPVKKMDSSVDNLEEMNCDIPAEANESEELNNQCASSDVEMSSNDLREVNSASSQNSTDTTKIITEANLSQNQRTDASSSTLDIKVTDANNKSDIVIEELDDSLENQSSVIDVNEAVPYLISDSPALDVKDAIIEESNSEIVIEEVEDSDVKDIDHSSNACDSSVDNDRKLSNEQIKSDISDVTNDNCVSMPQNVQTATKKL